MVKMSTTSSPSHSTSNLPLQGMSTGEHVVSEHYSSRHSPDSVSDFSVISNSGSQSPGTVVVNGTATVFSHLQDVNLMLNSAVPDMTLEQMQSAFADLLRENLQLKDDVQQSNVAMREQFELMVKLQVHVEEFQKDQTMRHEKARAVIEQLREENAELRENAAVLATSAPVVERLQYDLANLKTTCERHEEDNEHQKIVNHQLNEEMVPLKSDFSQLKANYLRLLQEKRELTAINAELQAKQTSRQRSPEEFYDASDNTSDVAVSQGFLLVPSRQNANLDMTLVEEKTIKDLLAQLNEEQNKNKELSVELAKQKETSETLSTQVEGQEEVIRRLVHDGPAAMQQQGALLLTELRASEHKFSLANNYLHKYRSHCDSLENMLCVYQDRLKGMQSSSDAGSQSGTAVDCLRGEIATLQATLSEEKAKSADEKKNLLDAQQKFNALFENHKKLEDNWANLTREQISRGRQSEAYYNLQEKYYQEKVDALMAKLVMVEDKLVSKQEELDKVHPEILRLKQATESIAILETQVELYKTDFRAEREAHVKIREEKERILEEMRLLRTRYQEAVETLAQLRSSAQVSALSADSVGHVRRHSHGRSHRNRSSYSPPAVEASAPASNVPDLSESPRWAGPESIFGAQARVTQTEARSPLVPDYICPKCRREFDEYEPLEKHVNACLDNSDPFIT